MNSLLKMSYIIFTTTQIDWGFPDGSEIKTLPTVQETQVHSLGGKIPQRRKWQATPIFLPGKSYGQRNLEGYSLWGHKRVGHNSATKQHNMKLVLTNRYIQNKSMSDCDIFRFLMSLDSSWHPT